MQTNLRALQLIILILGFSLSGLSQNYSRVKIYADAEGLRQLQSAGVCIDHGDQKKGVFFISDFSEQELAIIKKKGFRHEVLIKDVQQHYREQNDPASSKYVTPPSAMTHGCNKTINYPTPSNFTLGSMAGFFTYAEIQAHLNNMATLFPNLVKAKAPLDSLTVEGRPVYWMKISDNPNVDENEPEMLYTAVHHAREPASVSQLIMYMYYLLENYNTNAEVKYLVDNLEMYFVPVVNPDGYIYNETTDPGCGGMWRKNRKDNGDGTFGIDLNRNYGYNWGFDDFGSSPQTSSDVYRGTAGFSEPETKNLRNFCNSRQFKLTLNYHTYGNLLIYPWGYQPSIYTPDSANFVEYAKYLTWQNHYNFGTADQTVEYVVNGSSDDWMYGEQSSKAKIFALTPEAGDAANGFWPPQNLIISICKENITQNLHAAHLLLKHGVATDEEPRYIKAATGDFNYNLRCLGMDVPASFTVSITPVSSQIVSVGSPKTYSNLTSLQQVNDSISFTIQGGTAAGTPLIYLLQVTNGSYSHSDTVVKVFGNPTVPFSSNGSTMVGWQSSTGWGVDNSHYYSSPSSLSDSPGANYPSNDSTWIRTTSSVNLVSAVSATLSFRARWELEPRFDYLEVQASDDNGNTWTPLCGKYSKPGNAFQDAGQPIYDGFMFPWVREEIDLDDYTGKSILLRFILKADNGNEYDGFFFDDLKVEVLANPTPSVQEQNAPLQFFMSPNPASGSITISSGELIIANVIVFDLAGREVSSMAGLNKKVFTYDVTDLNKGIYFIEVRDIEGKMGVQKLVKE